MDYRCNELNYIFCDMSSHYSDPIGQKNSSKFRDSCEFSIIGFFKEAIVGEIRSLKSG